MDLTAISHIPGEEVRLIGISDTHIGSPDFDEALFERDLAAIAADAQARVVVVGDLLSYVTKRSRGDIYYERYTPSQQKRIAKEYLKKISNKILCIVGGNHDEGRSEEDAQPILEIADDLGITYCRGEALLKIPVGRKENYKPAVYTVYMTHGWTASRLIGGKSLNLDRLKDIVLADVYLMAHTHTQHCHKDTYYVPDLYNGVVREVTRHYVNLGSYQRRGQYPIRRGLPAQVLGTPIIRLSGKEKKVVVEI